MTEILILAEEAPEGGFAARALSHPIFTEGDIWAELQANVREAVFCHFEEDQAPASIRIHFVRDEVIAL